MEYNNYNYLIIVSFIKIKLNDKISLSNNIINVNISNIYRKIDLNCDVEFTPIRTKHHTNK